MSGDLDEGWKAAQQVNRDSSSGASLGFDIRFQMILVTIAVLVVYWSSFSVPFYLDDFSSIVENPVIQAPTDLGDIWDEYGLRAFGYLTFALDHRLHGDQVEGYHVTNTLIHLLAGWAVLGLLGALLRSPAMRPQQDRAWMQLIPLLAALLFVLHPLQTQAVTYVVQRLASLTALLYIGSMACYAWGRVSARGWWFGLAVICALLAFLTKQNAFTLPLAVLVVELLFFQRLSIRQRWALLIVTALGTLGFLGALSLEALDRLTRETGDISRGDYFATQALVLWRYLGLFLYPWPQRLEYDIQLQEGFSDPLVLIALSAHAALLLFAFWIWSRAPLVSFGILFFYLAHLVESSFMPITDLMFEHRTYLPNLGLAVLFAVGVVWLLGIKRSRTVVLAATGLILAVAGWLTLERNRAWQDPIAFLEAETRLSPGKERAWTSYGKELMRLGRFKEALPAFGTALNLARTEEGLEVDPATLVNAILALHHTRQYRKAFELERLLPLDALPPIVRSRLHEVKGMSFLKLKRSDLAEKEFQQAIRFFPNPNAEAGLATLELAQGKRQAAALRANRVLQQQPGNRLAQGVLEHLRRSRRKAPSTGPSPAETATDERSR